MVFLYKTAKVYATFLKLLGYERGTHSFLDRLELKVPKGARILDIACGSGVIGLRLLERIPGSTLLATDLEKNFLKETLVNARDRGIDPRRITVGVSDITHPDHVTLTDGTPLFLTEHTFDIVTIGGSSGYSRDQVETLKTVLRLIKPGGYLINLEMNERPIGIVIATWYNCRPMPPSQMLHTIESEGHSASVVPFRRRDFPANLTRIGVIVKTNRRKVRSALSHAPMSIPISKN